MIYAILIYLGLGSMTWFWHLDLLHKALTEASLYKIRLWLAKLIMLIIFPAVLIGGIIKLVKKLRK
jgi:hypothetical protein